MIRITLNYKGIRYKTVWVEYPDIEDTCKKIGAAPTSKTASGQDHYTFPVIIDDSNGKVIADSKAIALYLEETYPDTPKVFPQGKEAAVELAFSTVYTKIMVPSFPITLPAVVTYLLPRSQEYYRRTREAMFGKRLEELSPPGEKRDQDWIKLKEGLSFYADILDKNGENKPYFLGDEFSFADALLIGFLYFLKIGITPEEWETIAAMNNGRWGKLLASSEKLLAADN